MLHLARKVRLMAAGKEQSQRSSRAPLVLVESGGDLADAALLHRLEEICPADISLSMDFEAEWVLNPVCQDSSPTDWAILPSLGDWVEVSIAGEQLAVRQPPDVIMEAQNASIGVQRELQWYFQERDSRILGYRSNPIERPCARTIFARRLLRYAATTMPSADHVLLEAWCTYLRTIVQERPFSSSNLLWPSRFERSLEACLARLERLLKKVKGNVVPEFVQCPMEQQVVAKATARRDMAGTFTTVPLERFVIFRQVAKANRVLSNVQTRLPLLPGLQTIAMCNSWAASIIFGTACLELMVQLAMEARAYSAGEVDRRTLTEDILVASGSAATFALGRYTSAIFTVGEGFAALVATQFGPSCAAFFAGIMLRAAGQEIQGGPRMRALRNAYASLGLSPAGASTYTPQDIETQLEFRLRRPGRTEKSTLRLWAAYAYIREHQHPDLTDPWRHVRDAWEGASDINYSVACEMLQIDPDTSFTSAELRRRYLQLSLTHHPDRPTGDHDTYLRLHAAYELLRCFCHEG